MAFDFNSLIEKNYSYLELEAIKAMFEMDLDPFNPEDVKAFWKSRGIDLDPPAGSNFNDGHWSYIK